MKKILIIGATSAIAKATARRWAEKGHDLYLVARDKQRLERIANDAKLRGANSVFSFVMDCNDFEAHTLMLQDVILKLRSLDIVLIAHGTLSNQNTCQQSVNETLFELNANALSSIALLTHLANFFEQQKHGVIAVISSVAGDRGRQSNYVYGSAKAMLTTFTSGLRQRLCKSNVSVVTILPGLIDTPMTKNFKKNILWATPETVAKYICNGVEKKKNIIYVPGYWRLIMAIIKTIPEKIFKRIAL